LAPDRCYYYYRCDVCIAGHIVSVPRIANIRFPEFEWTYLSGGAPASRALANAWEW
jgi:hypothetical protein